MPPVWLAHPLVKAWSTNGDNPWGDVLCQAIILHEVTRIMNVNEYSGVESLAPLHSVKLWAMSCILCPQGGTIHKL